MERQLENLSQEQQALIADHLAFVIEQTKKINLTNITNSNEGIILHVEDSLAGLVELNKAPEGSFADIGTGGGYPGIPLAIASQRKAVLIEAINKKAEILDRFVKQVGLDKQIQVYAMRSEEVAQRLGQNYAAITIRAVAELPTLVELATPLLAMDGLLICYKGQPSELELVKGCKAATLCGLEETSIRSFLLPDGQTARTIIVYKKTAEPTVSLPRRSGMAKKRPLV